MTDYEVFLKLLERFKSIDAKDVDYFYNITTLDTNGYTYVTLFGENEQKMEFDFDSNGKFEGWY